MREVLRGSSLDVTSRSGHDFLVSTADLDVRFHIQEGASSEKPVSSQDTTVAFVGVNGSGRVDSVRKGVVASTSSVVSPKSALAMVERESVRRKDLAPKKSVSMSAPSFSRESFEAKSSFVAPRSSGTERLQEILKTLETATKYLQYQSSGFFDRGTNSVCNKAANLIATEQQELERLLKDKLGDEQVMSTVREALHAYKMYFLLNLDAFDRIPINLFSLKKESLRAALDLLTDCLSNAPDSRYYNNVSAQGLAFEVVKRYFMLLSRYVARGSDLRLRGAVKNLLHAYDIATSCEDLRDDSFSPSVVEC